MSDDDLDRIPDMQVRQVWRPVGTWEGTALPEGRKPKPRISSPRGEGRARVKALVLAAEDGMTIAELMALTGAEREAVMYHLQTLRRGGELAISTRGRNSRWVRA
ncbi:MAG: hypothetical protein V4792_09805 [Pseudomonadota bacterium]